MLYPIGIQNFEDIRRGGYVYVDKTGLIYKLAATGKYYFLSRPRRFGKSLLVSTMEAYFQGKKELFDGLAVASLEKDWVEYPVLHFDLGGESYNDESALDVTLSQHLANMETKFGVTRRFDSYPSRILFCSATEASWMAVNKAVTNSSERPYCLPCSIIEERMLSQREAWTIAML